MSPDQTLLRVVFDTNVYLAAAFNPNGYAHRWLSRAVERTAFTLFISDAIFREIERKLEEKAIARKDVVSLLELIDEAATRVYPLEKINAIETDPDDNIVLECAVEAKAQLIISADPDLYKLKTFRNIVIRHPSDLKYIFQDA